VTGGGTGTLENGDVSNVSVTCTPNMVQVTIENGYYQSCGLKCFYPVPPCTGSTNLYLFGTMVAEFRPLLAQYSQYFPAGGGTYTNTFSALATTGSDIEVSMSGFSDTACTCTCQSGACLDGTDTTFSPITGPVTATFRCGE
jgi:hypothetical protein